eukprot:scaffold58497_cov40-Prasinocladus_malaysianus.AAC.1
MSNQFIALCCPMQPSSRCLTLMETELSAPMSSAGCAFLLNILLTVLPTVKVFNVINLQCVSSLQACVLYRDSKQKFRKALRGAMVLALIVLVLLAANCGLVFAVVYLTKASSH